MRKRRRAAALVAGLALVLGGTALAIAQTRGPASIETVEAEIVWSHIKSSIRFCESPTGQQLGELIDSVITGTATGHPRLSGVAIQRLPRAVFDVQTGAGWERGTLTIRDPDTHHVKVRARFVDAGIANIFVGTLHGRVHRHATLAATWRTTLHANGALTSQIGGVAPDGRLPAVIAKGGCKGPLVKFEEPIPPPTATARSGSGGRLSSLFAR